MRKTGYSLIELLFVMAAAATASGIAVPPLLRTIDGYRTAGAVRYISTRIQRTRMEAVNRSTNAAMQFLQVGTGYSYAVYVDGNGDGVRTSDIKAGMDQRLGAIEHLPDNYVGVDFGLLPGLPPVDPYGPPPGSDPIKLGSSDLLSYSSIGTSSSGAIYVRGRSRAQYAIRILGDTGRIHVLKFDPVHAPVEGPMTTGAVDRRGSRRSPAIEHGIVSAQVRPGHLVLVIDVSAGGVSIEISRRLLPGSSVELQISTAHRRITVRGRVLRCAVFSLQSTSVSYRAAILFDHQWPCFLESRWSEYAVPTGEAGPEPAERVDTTRDVV